MNKKIIIPIILIVLLVICGFFYFSLKDSDKQHSQNQEIKINANNKKIEKEESEINSEESDVEKEESETESKLTEDEVKSQFNEVINQAFSNLGSDQNVIVYEDNDLANKVISAYNNKAQNKQILSFLNVTTKTGKLFMGDGGGQTSELESAPKVGDAYQLTAIDYSTLNDGKMKASVSYQVAGEQYQRSFIIEYSKEINSIQTTEN